MSIPAPKRKPTFEELYKEIERLPQRLTGEILVAGVLTTMSRPGSPHEHTLAYCGRALDRFDRKFDGDGPELRTVEVYEAIAGRATLVATARDADVVRLPPFDTELSLGRWWKTRPEEAAVSSSL